MPSRSTNDTMQAAIGRRIAFSEIFANRTMCHLRHGSASSASFDVVRNLDRDLLIKQTLVETFIRSDSKDRIHYDGLPNRKLRMRADFPCGVGLVLECFRALASFARHSSSLLLGIDRSRHE